MSDIPGTSAADALSRLHARFAEPVSLTGGAWSGVSRQVVRGNVPGDPFHGPGRSGRRTWFEFRPASDYPLADTDGVTIIDSASVTWRVIDTETLDGIDAVRVTVERAA